VDECNRAGLPLVALRREVRFAAVTQAVGERLVDEQLNELREAQRVHDTFTELSVAEAGPDAILGATQQLAGAAVVLESEQHQVLDYRAGPADVTAFLDDWERRSRSVQEPDRVLWDQSNGWLVTRLGRRERGWGRLIIEAPHEPPQRLTALAERAAAALAMHRLHDRSRDSHVRRLHHELLVGLLSDPTDVDLAQRIRLAGVAVGGRRYVGIVMRPAAASRLPASVVLDEMVTASLRAAEVVRSPSLVAGSESGVRVLLPVPGQADPHKLVDRFVGHVRGRLPVVATAGSAVAELTSADRTIREAMHVLSSLPETYDPDVVHRLEDLHVRGLLSLLSHDDRLRAFVERELAPLRDDDSPGHESLLHVARVLIEEWGSKSAAAARLNVSRPVLYDRIGRIERALGASLADPEVRTSLHVAFLADGPVAQV
jgi:purine catabolism regulator